MPTLSGSLNVTGSVNVTGSFTLNGNIVTSGAITSNGSAVITTVSTGSFVVNSQTGSFATTGSNTFNGSQTIISASSNFTIGQGAINLQATSSTILPSIILASSGGVPKYIKIGTSGIYSSLVANGDLYFYGSNSVNIESNNDVNIWSRLNATSGATITGSLTVTGGVTASLQGSASYAENSTFANNIQITNTTSSVGGPFYPVFTATNNGYGGALVDTSIFIYTPTTNTLSVNIAGNISGSLTGSLLGSLIGTSSYATRAVTSDKLKTANIAGGGTFYPLIGSNYTGDVDVYAISSPNYKYDLGINQLVVSSISASFTGSLLGTGSYALQSLSASYAPSSPAFPYAGNAVISGSMVITGSLTISGSDTLTNIGPARFRSNIANSATITALEITGGLQVSRSIDSVNRYLSTGITPVVQWGASDLKLVDANNNTSVMWGARNFFDENGLTSIDWNAATSFAPRTLLDASELASVKWGSRQLVYSSGSTAFNWGTPDKIFMSGSVIVTGSLVVTGGITGSLLGTATTASNITPSIASDGVNRILTSDGDGTVTAEANLTFDGNTLLVAGSLNQSGSFKIGYSGSNYSTFQVSKNISNYDNVFITSGADGLSHEDMIYIQTHPTTASNLIGIQTQGKIVMYADTAAFRSNASGGSRVQITGSLNVANGITGSLQGTGSYALQAISASYAPGSSAFPYTGNALISGSLAVSGSLTLPTIPDVSTGYINMLSYGGIRIRDNDFYEMKLTVDNPSGNSSAVSPGFMVMSGVGGYGINTTVASSTLGETESTINFSGPANSRIQSSQQLILSGSSSKLILSGSTANITGSFNVKGNTNISGSTTIDSILTIVPRTTLPTGIASGSIIVSGSATGIKPYFWNGATWTAMF